MYRSEGGPATRLFTIVRNPYERVISDFYWQKRQREIQMKESRGEQAPGDNPAGQRGPEDDPAALNRWVRKIMAQIKDKGTCPLGHCYPMHQYVYSDGQQIIDHVLRLENLEVEFPDLMWRYNLSVPLEHKNKRQSTSSLAPADLSDESIRLINAHFRRDFELFEYEMLSGQGGAASAAPPRREASTATATEALRDGLLLPSVWGQSDHVAPNSRRLECEFGGGAYRLTGPPRQDVLSAKLATSSIYLPRRSPWGYSNAAESVAVPRDAVTRIEQPAVYLGLVTGAYGHFLLESLGRFLPLVKNDLSPRPTIGLYNRAEYVDTEEHRAANCSVVPGPWNVSRFIQRLNLTGAFGIEIQLVTRPLLASTLFVPEQAAQLYRPLPSEMRQVFQTIARHGSRVSPLSDHERRRARCLYLSRKQAQKRKVANEGDVEALFQRQGFQILTAGRGNRAPELSRYQAARIVAGFEGTNLHNSVFMKPNGTVVVLAPLGGKGAGLGTKNQRFIERMQGAELIEVGSQRQEEHNDSMVDIKKLASALAPLFLRWKRDRVCS